MDEDFHHMLVVITCADLIPILRLFVTLAMLPSISMLPQSDKPLGYFESTSDDPSGDTQNGHYPYDRPSQ